MITGIGWRHAHERALFEERPPLPFIEVHSENFFAEGGAPLALLARARAHYAVSLHGVGLALGSGVEYQRGLPAQGRLAALDLPTLADSPQIRIELIDSDAEPFDPGELPVAPVAPAIANALFSATGLRLRRLPLLSGGI